MYVLILNFQRNIIRVLNLWQKNNVFSPQVIQPLLDMADPNHPLHQEIQQQQNNTANGMLYIGTSMRCYIIFLMRKETSEFIYDIALYPLVHRWIRNIEYDTYWSCQCCKKGANRVCVCSNKLLCSVLKCKRQKHCKGKHNTNPILTHLASVIYSRPKPFSGKVILRFRFYACIQSLYNITVFVYYYECMNKCWMILFKEWHKK